VFSIFNKKNISAAQFQKQFELLDREGLIF